MARPVKLAAATPKSHHPTVEPKALPITAFAKAYGVTRVTVFRALRAGRLKAVVIGKRKLILLDSVQPAEGA